MFSLLFYEIIPFHERKDNILKSNFDDVVVTASGSIGQYYNDSCHQTNPIHAIDDQFRKIDWCSNMNKTNTDYPWLVVSLKSKKMVLTGYAIRSGCCYYDCCCTENGKRIFCCCDLYSWSLQGSNDNVTWVTIHKVEADKKFYDCANRYYDIVNHNRAFKYIRLIQDQPWPGCNYCICINKMELYGHTDSMVMDTEDDNEDVSIIGKIKYDVDY